MEGKRIRRVVRAAAAAFFFLIQFTFGIVLCQCQMGGTMVRQLCTLQSGPLPDVSSAHLTPHTQITMLLTLGPIICDSDSSVTTSLCSSVLLPFHPLPLRPLPIVRLFSVCKTLLLIP